MIGLLFGERLVVGVESDPDEPDRTRVYLDARWKGRYVLTSGESAKRVSALWAGGGHVTVPIPAGSSIYIDAPAEATS